MVLDAAAVQAFARRYGLEWDNPQGIRRIIVRADAGGLAASHGREVLTYTHSLITGQIVQPDDLIWAKAAAAPVDAAPNTDVVIGMAARRPLREGDPVLARDVTAPIIIKAGDTVDVTYADDGVIADPARQGDGQRRRRRDARTSSTPPRRRSSRRSRPGRTRPWSVPKRSSSRTQRAAQFALR